MTKSEFIKAVAAEAKITQKDAREVLDAVQSVVYETMKNGESVKIIDSVTLSGKEVAERTARNPQTGEAVVVPAHMAPKCKFGTIVKEYIKG
nr:MAG TPA: DNA binding protein [Bacteriophage sp.]